MQDRFLVIKNLGGNFDVVDTTKRITIEDNLSRTDARQEAKMRNEKASNRKSKTTTVTQ